MVVARVVLPDPGMPEMAIRSLSFGGRAWYLDHVFCTRWSTCSSIFWSELWMRLMGRRGEVEEFPEQE